MTGRFRRGQSDGLIGPLGASLIVAGNMIGSGIYLLPSTLGAIGSVSTIGWVVALAGALVVSLVFSLLSFLRPEDRGIAGYVSHAFGRGLGCQASLLYWLSAVIGNSAIAIAAASYLARLLPFAHSTLTIQGLAALLIVGCVGLNATGARSVAGASGVTLALGLAPVLVFTTFGWFWFDARTFAASWNVSGGSDTSAVISSLPMIAWAFLGLESAGAAAHVVRNPKRNVPLATLAGVALAGILYAVMCAVLSGLAPAADLAASNAPLADVAVRLWGAWAGIALAACAAIKATGTLAGWTLVGAETGTAAARIGLFPRMAKSERGEFLAHLALGGAIMIGASMVSGSRSIGSQFGMLINATTVLSLVVYGFCALSLLRLDALRLSYRIIALLAVTICILLVASSDIVLVMLTGGIMVIGAILAWALSRNARAALAASDPA